MLQDVGWVEEKVWQVLAGLRLILHHIDDLSDTFCGNLKMLEKYIFADIPQLLDRQA